MFVYIFASFFCIRLEIGYIYLKNGTLLPLESIDLDFWQHGEEGIPPMDYAFTFTAGKLCFLIISQFILKGYLSIPITIY